MRRTLEALEVVHSKLIEVWKGKPGMTMAQLLGPELGAGSCGSLNAVMHQGGGV